MLPVEPPVASGSACDEHPERSTPPAANAAMHSPINHRRLVLIPDFLARERSDFMIRLIRRCLASDDTSAGARMTSIPAIQSREEANPKIISRSRMEGGVI